MSSWHHGVVTRPLGKEALGCTDGLIPHYGGFGKTSATFWIARPSKGSVGKSGTVCEPGSFVLLPLFTGSCSRSSVAIPLSNIMVRMVMAEAAQRQEAAADRISFVDELRWLLDSKAEYELVPLKVNLNRSGRAEPRVRKRLPKELPGMKKPRSEWRKQLMRNTFAD